MPDPPPPPSNPDALNTVTPRIFIAATRQDDGKTTSSLGLFEAIGHWFPRMAYIKPVGQRFVDVAGRRIDEDSWLISDTFKVKLPIEAMNPIVVGPGFTRNFLDHDNAHELEQAVIHAFNRAAWEHDFVIIEGTGHAGVGSVFGLSNAHVARLLHSRVIIVSQGGLGKPIDEISLNLALFEKLQVPVIGVILNKVLPQKMAQLLPYAEKGLARLGLPLLGIIPLQQELSLPTINQVIQLLHGTPLNPIKNPHTVIHRVHIGAMSAPLLRKEPLTAALLITPGDREDLILEILSDPQHFDLAGVVLCDGRRPSKRIQALIHRSSLPFVQVEAHSYQITTCINQMTVKTEPGDFNKIHLIQSLIHRHVRIDQILRAAQPYHPPATDSTVLPCP